LESSLGNFALLSMAELFSSFGNGGKGLLYRPQADAIGLSC
jgi:hypothetical protein